jgi:hypothetical protein
MSIDEGINRAVKNMKDVLIRETPADMWWVLRRT